MSYCSDCIGGFTVNRKINGEKFHPNFRPTTTDMLQINEQICSDNYDIPYPGTLMPKPTMPCGADGQPENLDFQFYEDRKCDGILDCENGFDESDCGMMETVDVPKRDENGPIENDPPVACCKYLRFERTFCHHIQLDSNPFGGASDAWECNDGLGGRIGSVFFRITGEVLEWGNPVTKDEWVLNSDGKPGSRYSSLYKKNSNIWEKNCPEGGYKSSLNDGYHHLVCVTEEQFKMNAPCLYKKFNPILAILEPDFGVECDVETEGDDDGDADGEGAGDDGDDSKYMPKDDFKRPKEYYNLQVGQFLIQLEMHLALSMKFPEHEGLSLTLEELENMATGEGLLEEVFLVTDELEKSFEITFKDLLDSDEHFKFEISIAEGSSPDLTELNIFIEYTDPSSTPMADDWQPDSLLDAILQAGESIASQMASQIAYQSEIHGILYHQTSKYLKIFEPDCDFNAANDFGCEITNPANIRNEDIKMINFEKGLENFSPHLNPTIRMLVDIEIELHKDDQIKEALKSKIYELGNGKLIPNWKPFHALNPFGNDGYTFFECQDDGVSGTMKTGSSMNLKKTSKRKRRHADITGHTGTIETETIVLLIDYVTNPESDYESKAIIDDLLSAYDSKTKSFPSLEEELYLEILELIEVEFDVYDAQLESHFEIETPSAFVKNIKDVGLGVTLQENFTPVQFINHYQMLHRVHVEVPTEEIFLETPSWLATMVNDMEGGKKPDKIENIESLHFLKSKLDVHDYITTKLVYALPGGVDIYNCKITAVLNAECLIHVNAFFMENEEDKTCIQFALECIEEGILQPLTLDELIDNNIEYKAIQDYLSTDTDPEIITVQRKKSQTNADSDEWSISYLYPVGEESTVTFNTVDELLKEYNAPYWFINNDDSKTKSVILRVEIEVKLREPFKAALTDESSAEFKKLAANVLPESIKKEFEKTNPFPGGATIITVTFSSASVAMRRKRRLAAEVTIADLEIFYTSNPDIPIEDVVLPNINDLSSSIVDEAKSALALSLVVDPTELENLKVHVDEPIIPCETSYDCGEGELCNMDYGKSGGFCEPCPGETEQDCIDSNFVDDLGTTECESVCVVDQPCATSDACDDGKFCNMDHGMKGGYCEPCPGDTVQDCVDSGYNDDLGTAECQSVCVGKDGTSDGSDSSSDGTGDGSDSGNDGSSGGSSSGEDKKPSCATCTSDQQSGPGLERISPINGYGHY